MLKISKKKDNTVIDEFKKMVFTSMVHLQINNAELSKLSGVTNSKISALKYGNSNTLKLGDIVKIAKVLKINLNDLKGNEQMRGFELIEGMNGELPIKATVHSAGVDFIASSDITIPAFRFKGKATLVPTGVKAFMQNDEYLQIFARSSIPVNLGLIMSNGVGIVDADYYNNEKNEGHIMIEFNNLTNEHITIEKGTRIAQGIFNKVLPVTHGVRVKNATRNGGFGSTGSKGE
jgi:deoxyuridine 5`-triphosphate nucleotidohydrolase|nr:MAG TPA: deoxyuridine 5'-triphosphate nucleotidohydrolase [Caudoviricetes sp.]